MKWIYLFSLFFISDCFFHTKKLFPSSRLYALKKPNNKSLEEMDIFDKFEKYSQEQDYVNAQLYLLKISHYLKTNEGLYDDPKILLLDEPSSGLTNEETNDLGFWIKDIQSILKITIIMIEHDMSFVNKVSDRILALNYGEILASGLPSEIKEDAGVKAAYMGE